MNINKSERYERTFRETCIRVDGVKTIDSRGTDAVTLVQSRIGTELPFHKQMIRNRQGATTNLSAQRDTIEAQYGTVSYREFSDPVNQTLLNTYVSSKCGFQLTEVFPNGIFSSVIDKARAQALGRYYSKIQSIQKSVEGQVMAGEIRETIKLLKHPFEQGVKLLTTIMSNKSTFRSMSRRSGDLWLQYRFGILPLISDIEGIKKIINSQAQKEFVGSERVYGQAESSGAAPWSGTVVGSGLDLNGTRTWTEKAELIIRFGYLHQAKSGAQARTDDLVASFLNVRDLPSTAWELIPWSFLIDYFVDVGSIIQAATTYTGAVVWTSQSLVTTRSCTLNIAYAKPRGTTYKLDSFTPTSVKRTIREVTRSTAPPGIPPLTFELPGSNIRLANIAALLTGLLKGK